MYTCLNYFIGPVNSNRLYQLNVQELETCTKIVRTMSSVYRGSCLCDSVKYEITGEPFTFIVCHCNNCKKVTGAAFMTNVFFQRKQVAVIQGAEAIQRYRDSGTNSGRAITRSFCSQCGSNLFITNDKDDITIVGVGTLDDSVNWVPRREAFPERRRPWVTGITFAPKSRSRL